MARLFNIPPTVDPTKLWILGDVRHTKHCNLKYIFQTISE